MLTDGSGDPSFSCLDFLVGGGFTCGLGLLCTWDRRLWMDLKVSENG